MNNVFHLHPERRRPELTEQQKRDDAIGIALVIAFFALGVKFLFWLVQLFISHFPL